MSSPHGQELHNLNAIATHVMEVFGARGHNVESAMRTDDAFDRGYCQSSLTRALVEDAVEEASKGVGMPRPSVPGGALELGHYDGFEERRYRVRKAKRLEDGSLHVLNHSDSGLTPAPPDEPQFFDTKQWVFAWIPDDQNNMIQEIVAAEVVDFITGSPGRLVFGSEVSLGSPIDPFPAGFQPSDEDLEGFEDDEGRDEHYGSAAS